MGLHSVGCNKKPEEYVTSEQSILYSFGIKVRCIHANPVGFLILILVE